MGLSFIFFICAPWFLFYIVIFGLMYSDRIGLYSLKFYPILILYDLRKFSKVGFF